MEEDLWEKVCNKETFLQAWEKIRANMGSPGIDRVSIEDFELNLSENLNILIESLKQGIYQPLLPLTREIPKDDGEKRLLKVPAVRDRIVQEAVLIILQPVFEKYFLDCSYGYRIGRSALQAVRRVERHIKKGEQWIVDADILDFFDRVNQELLINLLSEKIADSKIIRLIKMLIELSCKDKLGIPQGAPISPLLANIYLHPLDQQLIKGPGHYIRYCDDFVILCISKEEAEKALENTKNTLERLFLHLNPEKTRICHINEGFTFLGFYFDKNGKTPSSKAILNLKENIKEVLSLNISKKGLEDRLKLIIRGWQNYFHLQGSERDKLLEEIENIVSSYGDSIPLSILKSALLIQEDKKEEAQEIISSEIKKPIEDSNLLSQLGNLCEISDMKEEAIEEYYRAIRQDSSNYEATYRLGLLYLNKGEIEKAIRFLQKAVSLSPESGEAYLALGKALEGWGLYGSAQKAFREAKRLSPKLAPSILESYSEQNKRLETTSFTNEDLETYIKLFSGREGVYAKQWIDNTGRIGYSPVYEHISINDIKEHLLGNETLGLYLMRGDNTVKVAVIDIDVSKKMLATQYENGGRSIAWESLVQSDANKIQELCKNLDINVYLERSGWKGIHCWFFFAQPVRAIEARKLLNKILLHIGEPPLSVSREIFPKENEVKKGGLGSLIKLPLGIHKITSKRTLFIDNKGEPYPAQFELLKKVRPISLEALRKAIDSLSSKAGINIKIIPVSEISEPLVRKLLEKCNIIRFLAYKAENERSLGHYERLVLLYTLGHLGDGGKIAIHQIIGHCINYSYNITERWIHRLKEYPISCPRIREMLSNITPGVGCYCEFPHIKGSYPSPPLHIDPNFILKIKNKQEGEMTKMQENIELKIEETIEEPGSLLQKYIKLKREKRNIEKEIQNLEEKLTNLFVSKGLESISTEFGDLKYVKREDKIVWILEL